MKACYVFYFKNFLFTFVAFEESENYLEMFCFNRTTCFLTIFSNQIYVIRNSSTFIYEMDNRDKGDHEKTLQSKQLKWKKLLEARKK